MSFIEQLKLKQTDQLPLVRPRISSRYESYPLSENDVSPDTGVNYSRTPPKRQSQSTSVVKPDAESTIEEGNMQESILSLPSEINRTEKTEPDGKLNSENVVNSHLPGNEGRQDKEKEPVKDSGEKIIELHHSEGLLIEKYYTGREISERGISKSRENLYSNKLQQFSLSPSAGNPEKTTPPEKAIKVNIGTVEVRAIIEPKPTPKKHSPTRKPGKSLQDYLDQKNKP